MATGNLNSNLEALLHTIYPSNKVADSIIRKHPTLAMLKKNTKFGGKSMGVPVQQTVGANASRTASTSFANTATDVHKEFLVTRAHDYSVAYLPREDWKASVINRDSAYADVAKSAIDSQMGLLTRRLSRDLFRNGSGSFATVTSESTTSLVLNPVSAARFVEVGDEIVVSAADGTGSVRSGTATVTAVNRSTGTLTSDSNWTAQIAALVAGDYVFLEGDHANPVTGTIGVKGLGSWVPATAPSASESFFGIDRSSDPSRLAGVRYSLSGSLREGLFDALVQANIETDATPDVIVMHGTKWAELAKELESDRVFPAEAKIGEFMFSALSINSPYGAGVKVVADNDCPVTSSYALDLDTWEFASAGPAPHIQDEDGQYIRASTADAYVVRLSWYGNLVCRNPGANMIITIS